MGEQVIILEPGEERAQHIARALSSRTAGKILDILADGEKPLSFIADQLNISLPQVKYHVDNLLDAGIIEVTREIYSVKGRRVKIYGLKHQILVVAPRMVNLKALLLKYSLVAGLFLLVAVAWARIQDHVLSPKNLPLLGGGSLKPVPSPVIAPGIMESMLTDPSTVLLFCAGGAITGIVAVTVEFFLIRRGHG